MRLSQFIRVTIDFREGAMFEHPPAMYKTIHQWMVGVYAGHVMALAERKLKRLTAYADEVDKNIAAAEKWLKALPAWVKKNRGKYGKSTKVYVGPSGQGQWYGVKTDDEEDDRLMLGIGKNRIKYDPYYDTWPIDEIVRVTERAINQAIEKAKRKKSLVTQSQERRQEERALPGQRKKQDDELVTLHVVIREAKKYTSKAKSYKTKASKDFKVDLAGWKYLTNYHKAEQQALKDLIAQGEQTIKDAKEGIKNLREVGQVFESAGVPGEEGEGLKIKVTLTDNKRAKYSVMWGIFPRDPIKWQAANAVNKADDAVKHLNKTLDELRGTIQPFDKAMKGYMERLRKRGWGKPPDVKATLFFERHVKRGGQWSVSEKHLQVDLGAVGSPIQSVDNFKWGIAKIERTLRHELQHLGQDALAHIKELKEDAGLPSPKIRQKGAEPGGHPIEQVDKQKVKEARKNLTAFMAAIKKLKKHDQKTKKFKFYHGGGGEVYLFVKLRIRDVLTSTGPEERKTYHIYEGDGSYGGDYTDLKDMKESIQRYYVWPIAQLGREGPRVRWDKPRIEHALRDVEFHTDLGNAVDDFMVKIPGIGKKDWRDFYHAFTGSKTIPSKGSQDWGTYWFFKALKEKNKPKWRTALREFAKEVKKRGFEAP